MVEIDTVYSVDRAKQQHKRVCVSKWECVGHLECKQINQLFCIGNTEGCSVPPATSSVPAASRMRCKNSTIIKDEGLYKVVKLACSDVPGSASR